jgi:hypothetical protein
MDAIGYHYGYIRQQFVGFPGSGDVRGRGTTHLKILLLIEKFAQLLAERRIITNQEYADHEGLLKIRQPNQPKRFGRNRFGFQAIQLMLMWSDGFSQEDACGAKLLLGL